MMTPIIETKRLILRPLKASDAEAVFEGWANDSEVSHFMRWNRHQNVEETREWLEGEEAAAPRNDLFNWGFALKDGERLIGSGGLVYSESLKMYELGYNLAKDCWGCGYGTEAAGAIVEFARDMLKVKEIYATHAIENAASARILQKLGFTFKREGIYSSFDGLKTFPAKEYILDLGEIKL